MAKFINIFLASSIVELKNERRDLSDDVSGSITMLLRNDNIAVNFVKCEYNHAGNDGSRDQDYLNQLLKDCEYSVFLFKTHLGDRTEEEYNVARKLQKEKKHIIFAYFLDAPENAMEQRLIEFRDNLGMDWELCDNIDAVKFRLSSGLLKRLGIRVDFPRSREEKFNQLIEMRQNMHQEIEEMLAEIEQIRTTPSNSIAAMVMKVTSIYKDADRWATATDYDKKKYCEILFSYADFLDKYGLYYESKDVYLRQIDLLEKIYGLENINAFKSYNNIGEIFRKIGDYPNAIIYFKKASAIVKNTLEPDNPNNAIVYNNIGLTYDNQGIYSEARRFYQMALDIHKKKYDTGHPLFAIFCMNIGSTYWKEGNRDRALYYYKQALEIQNKVLDKGHPDIANTYNNIGTVLDDEGKHNEALIYYQRALAIRENSLGKNHPSTATVYHNIGFSYYKMMEYRKALHFFEKALLIAKSVLGDLHPNTKMTQKWVDATKKQLDNRDI